MSTHTQTAFRIEPLPSRLAFPAEGGERGVRPRDPQNTDLGESEELSLLTVEEGGLFSARIEVEAADRSSAESEAVGLVSKALRDSGFAEEDAPLGQAVVTGIDSEF